MGIEDFTHAAVETVAVELFEDFLNGFEKLINRKDDNLEIEELSDDSGIRVVKLATEESAMALVRKDRCAIDLAAHDPKASLIPIGQDTFDKLLEKVSIIEDKYSNYKVVRKGNFEGRYASIPQATPQEEQYMLNACVDIIDTLDGKPTRFNNLNHKTFDKVTIVCNDEDFIVTFTEGGANLYGATTMHGRPRKFSKAVSIAMRTAFDLVRKRLKNSLPLEMQLILPRLQKKFDELPPAERDEFLKGIQKNLGID